MLHTAGGMVGGDRLSLTANLLPQAQALVTTASAAKVYRSNGTPIHQTTQLKLSESTSLEWLPQETIIFDGALYRQDLRVDLAPGAVWLGWDITRLGRSARGERFLSGLWQSHIEVWQGDRLLWLDPQQIVGGSEMLQSLHGLAGCPVIGSLAFVGQTVSQELVEQARLLWTKGKGQRAEGRGQKVNIAAEPLSQAPNLDLNLESQELTALYSEVGVSRLMSGLLCRYRGHSSTEARRWFVQVWHLVRRECLQRSECIPRVWQLF